MSKAPLGAKLAMFSARSPRERFEIYRFRYQRLVSELGGDSVHADHRRQIIKDNLDASAQHLCLKAETEIVAALRLNIGNLAGFAKVTTTPFCLDSFGEFRDSVLSMTDRLVLAEGWDDTTAPALTIAAAYKLARRLGSRFDFTHCAPAMVGPYEQLGYRRYTDNYVDEDDGYQVPLVLLTEDIARLRDTGSPLHRLCGSFNNTSQTADWFAKTFPEASALTPSSAMSEDQFWRFLARRLNAAPLEGIPLLQGVEHRDAMRFIRASTVLHCRAGDALTRRGEVGREMYIVLSGAVEVRLDDTSPPIQRLEKGEVFGEVGYLSSVPRTADVIAADDAEVLAISQTGLRRTMEEMPATAAAVLFNLSVILCQRLGDTNARFLDPGRPATPDPVVVLG